MMIAPLMPFFYVGAIYLVSRLSMTRGNARHVVVVDVLMINWLLCEAAVHIISSQQLPAAFLCIDIASALWLTLRVKGAVSGLAEIFYIAIIMFNAVFFFGNAFDVWTHWIGLSLLAWGQLIGVTGGIMRHDLVKAARRAVARLGLRNNLAIGDREDQA